MRITARRERKKTKVLYLEGKISREWVKELQTEISKGIDKGEKIILDFLKVRYLDEEAAKMLSQMPPEKVGKRNCSLLIQELLRTGRRGIK